MNPGIYFDMPWDDYCKIKAINPSMLKHGRRSMKRLRRALDGELQPDPKRVAVGNAVHCIVANEEHRYCVLPAFEKSPDNLTKAGKQSDSKNTEYYRQMVEEWRLQTSLLGQFELEEAQLNTANKVVRGIREHCGNLIDKSRQEVVVVGAIEGVPMKTRLDGLCDSLVWDIKTTTDVADKVFFRVFERLAYDFSAAVHIELLRQNHVDVDEYLILAAETQDDYDVRILTVPREVTENALTRVQRCMAKYRDCLAKDIWPGIGDGQIFVSQWAMDDEEEVESPS